jgi:serine O-acetyltransferase
MSAGETPAAPSAGATRAAPPSPGPAAETQDIPSIVARLRALRLRALDDRQRRDRPPRLPARRALAEALEHLAALLFPYRLGLPELGDEGIDAYVGHLLDITLRSLTREIQRELEFSADAGAVAGGDPDQSAHARARGIARAFGARLPVVRETLDADILAAFRGDPAARSIDEVLVCYPGVRAIINHRLAHELHLLGAHLCARMIAEISHSTTGIDIHPGARIAGSFFIDHGTGVVIGETCEIGERVRLYHGVTLGAKRFPVAADGALAKGHARHPIVEDDVVIYAGATILGRITIGRGSTIGGNVWLTHSVPAGSSIAQTRPHEDQRTADQRTAGG